MNDVEVIHQTANEHILTFDNDVADAVIGCEPERSLLLKKGASILFDSGHIPGEIVDVIAVRTGYLQQNPGSIQALLHGWFEAINFLYNDPDDAAVRMSSRMQITKDEILISLKGIKIPTYTENMQLLDGEKPILISTTAKLNGVMLANKLINTTVNIDSLLFSGPLIKRKQKN